MPSDFQSARVDSWHVSVQRELTSSIILDLRMSGIDGWLAAVRELQPGAAQYAAGTIPLQQRRPIPGSRTSPTPATAAGHAITRCRPSRLAPAFGLSVQSSLTLSQARDMAPARSSSNGNAPSPQNYYDLEAHWGLSGYHQPKQHDQLRVERPLDAAGGRHRCVDVARPAHRGLAGGGHQQRVCGEPVTFTYTPTTAAQVSGITQDFRGANIYRPNVSGIRSCRRANRRMPTTSIATRC